MELILLLFPTARWAITYYCVPLHCPQWSTDLYITILSILSLIRLRVEWQQWKRRGRILWRGGFPYIQGCCGGVGVPYILYYYYSTKLIHYYYCDYYSQAILDCFFLILQSIITRPKRSRSKPEEGWWMLWWGGVPYIQGCCGGVGVPYIHYYYYYLFPSPMA